MNVIHHIPASKRRIFSLDSFNFSKNLEFVEKRYAGKFTKLSLASNLVLPLHSSETQNNLDEAITKSMDELIRDMNQIPWLPEKMHAESFANMFVNEVNLCLANGLYKVLKKLRHPTLISKSFSAIKKVRDYALEISKTRFESFQQEKNFSLDTNVERALVVFRKKLRQCFSSQKFRQDVNTATRGSSGSPQTMLVDELQMDLKEIDSAIPYSSLHQRTLALQQTLPDIVHSINAKHQIRSDVLKEFRNDTVPRHLSIAQMPPTMVTTRSSTPISLQDDIHFTSSDIAHSKAQDHPLIQMSISRRFKPKCNSSSNQPIARYLSTTSRRISHYTDQPWIHLVETESQNDIKNRVNLTQTTPLSGIGQARFHQKSTQDDIGLNIWDLVHWLMDDDREGGYGPEADYDMARSQEVEELFEEILRTNPQNHYTLNEPLQAHKYPAIPPNSASSRLMHPLELPQTTKASVLPPPPSAVRHTPSRIQYHTRQEHEVHVHADQYAENRSAAMHATPSSRPEYSKYNYGGYIPQVMIMTKHPDCNFDDYLSFVQRNPTDFLVFTPTITVIKDVVIPTPLVTSMTSPYLQGFWQPSTVQSMTISPYADRFQRVCRRLECNLNWTEMMKMSEDEVHAIAKQFEKIARCILQREQRLAQWIRYEYAHCHPARFWSEGSAARLEETKQRDDWLELLRSDEHKVKNALQELKKLHYHSPVMYRGQVYLDKMNHDKLDLLHQLTRFEK